MSDLQKNKEAHLLDKDLIRLFEDRHEEAIAGVQAKYGAYLKRFTARFLADERDREEAVNDALLGAWQAIPPHKPLSLAAFLTTLTRRAAIKRLREQGRRKEVPREYQLALEELEEILPDRGSAEDELLAAELSRSLEGFLTGLPLRRRKLFLSRYYDACSVKEAAGRAGVSLSTAEKELRAIRLLLKQHLEKEGYTI